jgi:hypothetical protein
MISIIYATLYHLHYLSLDHSPPHVLHYDKIVLYFLLYPQTKSYLYILHLHEYVAMIISPNLHMYLSTLAVKMIYTAIVITHPHFLSADEMYDYY